MKEKKEKKKWGLIVLIIIIMIGTSFSFVLVGFQPQKDVVRYNDLKFVKHPDRWEAKIKDRNAAFSFLPNEVEDIPASGDIASRLQNRLEIDVTSDSNSTYKEAIAVAQHQMGLTLSQYNIYVRRGFTSNNTFNLPIITCSDSTAAVPVVYFRHGNVTGVSLENNCIIAAASINNDFIKVKDKLLYALLGVAK
ncbi:hypothetical protein HYY70_05160 [Candidatus Woesearchaeota archaeon]|nr:hypothetical protein [Candidatus Woesearchaeota archaeon]